MLWKNLRRFGFLALLLMLQAGSATSQWFKDIFPVNSQLSMIKSNGNDLFVGTHEFPDNSRLFRSIDGLPWTLMDVQPPVRYSIWDVAVADSMVFAVAELGIWRSKDYGGTWEGLSTGALHRTYMAVATVRHRTADTLFIFCASNGDGIYRSSDDGDTWQPVNNGVSQKGVLVVRVNGFLSLCGSPQGRE